MSLEREHHQQSQSFSNGHVGENVDSEMPARLTAEASIKSALELFVKLSAGFILDSWSESNRYNYFMVMCALLSDFVLIKVFVVGAGLIYFRNSSS